MLLLVLIFVTLDQANVPKIDRPDVVAMSPSLKKAVADVQKQCPTCATIDLNGGKQTWLTPRDPLQTMSQIDPPDGCTLTQWTLQASRELKTSLEKALTAPEWNEFQKKEPKDCDRKAFGYYLDVAKQLLPKQK